MQKKLKKQFEIENQFHLIDENYIDTDTQEFTLRPE